MSGHYRTRYIENAGRIDLTIFIIAHMANNRQIGIVILSVFGGIILAFLFNFFILDKIIIPDPCYYHSHDPNKIFYVFYSLPSSEGYHPFPTKINFILTGILGAFGGLVFYKLRKINR